MYLSDPSSFKQAYSAWLEAEIARLKNENLALVKQWNDLDIRNEKRHRVWDAKVAELEAENARLKESVKGVTNMKGNKP